MNQSTASHPIPESEQIRIAETSLSRQLDWIKGVESKVSINAAVGIAMLGLLVAETSSSQLGTWGAIGIIALGGSAVIASLVFCALASFPRVKSPNLSLVFFGSITKHNDAEFARRFRDQTAEEYLADLITQLYRNAEIAGIKFGKVKCSTVLLLCGVPLWLASLFLLGSL